MPRDSTSKSLRTRLEAEAAALGFAELRIARPGDAAAAGGRLAEWVAEGRHGDVRFVRLAWVRP